MTLTTRGRCTTNDLPTSLDHCCVPYYWCSQEAMLRATLATRKRHLGRHRDPVWIYLLFDLDPFKFTYLFVYICPRYTYVLVTIYISRMMYTYIIHSIIYINFLRSLCSLGVVFACDQDWISVCILFWLQIHSHPVQGFHGGSKEWFIGYQPKLHALLLVGGNHPPTLLQPLFSEHLVGGKTVMHCSCKAHHEERTAFSSAINYKGNPSKVPATF